MFYALCLLARVYSLNQCQVWGKLIVTCREHDKKEEKCYDFVVVICCQWNIIDTTNVTLFLQKVIKMGQRKVAKC